MVRGLVPAEMRVEYHRQEQIVPIVDDDDLAAGAFDRRMIDQVLLRAVRADIALERELTGDDFLDRDFLFPAVSTVPLLAARLGHLLRAAQRTLGLRHRFPRHSRIIVAAPCWGGRGRGGLSA